MGGRLTDENLPAEKLNFLGWVLLLSTTARNPASMNEDDVITTKCPLVNIVILSYIDNFLVPENSQVEMVRICCIPRLAKKTTVCPRPVKILSRDISTLSDERGYRHESAISFVSWWAT